MYMHEDIYTHVEELCVVSILVYMCPALRAPEPPHVVGRDERRVKHIHVAPIVVTSVLSIVLLLALARHVLAPVPVPLVAPDALKITGAPRG